YRRLGVKRRGAEKNQAHEEPKNMHVTHLLSFPTREVSSTARRNSTFPAHSHAPAWERTTCDAPASLSCVPQPDRRRSVVRFRRSSVGTRRLIDVRIRKSRFIPFDSLAGAAATRW